MSGPTKRQAIREFPKRQNRININQMQVVPGLFVSTDPMFPKLLKLNRLASRKFQINIFAVYLNIFKVKMSVFLPF